MEARHPRRTRRFPRQCDAMPDADGHSPFPASSESPLFVLFNGLNLSSTTVPHAIRLVLPTVRQAASIAVTSRTIVGPACNHGPILTPQQAPGGLASARRRPNRGGGNNGAACTAQPKQCRFARPLRCHSWRERGDTGRQRGTPGNNERRIGEGKPGAPARGVSLSPTTISKIQDSFVL